ncbi:protein yellow [Coccinella septempunctata]|uniref:protein yellow n=1 Tax=Coccinella septempunctata TaxID=41139 RepID=UPI001D0633C5|nr:protein yellow [Coccinella septempunctata]
MGPFLVLLGLMCLQASADLDVKFQWNQLDFEFPSENHKKFAVEHEDFIQENNLPLGLEVYENKLFITVPRWKSGVAASLAYVDITDSRRSPKLRPYPNWPAHNIRGNSVPEIVSPFRIKADQCDRLWVLDTGNADLLGDTKILAPPRITVYNLKNDSLIRQYVIPKDQLKEDSFLANIVVEVVNCEDSFAYIGDLGKGALIVYSWKNNTSWKITHNYFSIDPSAGDLNVSGIALNWNDAIFGLALTPPNDNGFSTLYFHPLVSLNEFSVSTEILRDPELARNSYHNFTNLGSRGPRGQSTASFYHSKTGVLFYGLINLNAIDCWSTTKPYTKEYQGRIYQNDVTMVFPNDVKVDQNDNLWVLSDRLPTFMYRKLDPLDVNFRILTAPVSEAIKGSVCETERSIVMDRFKPNAVEKNVETTTQNDLPGSSSTFHMSLILLFITLVLSIGV